MIPGTEPICAYRVQLDPDNGFDRVTELLPHLRSLGVSHLYLSPIAEAEPGSRHGYDVVDPTRVRAELGGRVAFDRLLRALDDHDLAWILDIVPNHVSIATPQRNPWFWDVLRHGRTSRHAGAFDIDWDHGNGRVLLPVLSSPLETELEQRSPNEQPSANEQGPRSNQEGTIRVDREGPEPVLVVYDGLRLPLAEGTGAPDDPLDDVLAAQHYRLIHWRDAERNMRRFFEIDTLAALSMEDPDVREATHALVAELAQTSSTFAGVRVDHVDGLADPDTYFAWLRDLLGPDRLILVEKILVEGESLPERWPVDGTTGYEFARLIDQLLVYEPGREAMMSTWHQLGGSSSYHDVERSAIEEVLRTRLWPDVERVLRHLDRHRELHGVVGADALVALVSQLGRYRTYLPHGGSNDAAVIRSAARRAAIAQPSLELALTELTGALINPASDTEREARQRFQQLSGPALAKGGEDRALYRHTPLSALNEVGANPDAPGRGPIAFHDWATEAIRHHPSGMLTTTTHDTKRSGDVRARLLALTHHTESWNELLHRWLDTGSAKERLHPLDDHLLLQSAIGAWPITAERLEAAMIKAVREAAVRSSWIDQSTMYEAAIGQRTAQLFEGSTMDRIASLVATIDRRGRVNALSQTLLRLTAPGFGDLYQGDEVRNLSLVDPDNRRPVEWDRVLELSAAVRTMDVARALDEPGGSEKLVLIQRTLAARRRHPAASTAYRPILDGGSTVAYQRGDLCVVVAIEGDGIEGGSIDADPTIPLPDGRWRHVLIDGAEPLGGPTALSTIVSPALPLALLER